MALTQREWLTLIPSHTSSQLIVLISAVAFGAVLQWRCPPNHTAAPRRTVLERFRGPRCLAELHLGHVTWLRATDPLARRPARGLRPGQPQRRATHAAFLE